MGLLYRHAGRVTAQNGGFRPGQCPDIVSRDNWLGGSTSHDTFAVKRVGEAISVVRTDTGNPAAGWAMDLEFECCGKAVAREFVHDVATVHRFDQIIYGVTHVRLSMADARIKTDNSVSFNSVSIKGPPTNCGSRGETDVGFRGRT